MYLAQARDWLWKSSEIEVIMKKLYSSWMMHQAILSDMHTSLIGISTPHLDYITPMVLSFGFLWGPISLFVHRDNLFTLGSYDLRSLSTLQEDSVLCYYLIPELLDILQCFLLLLFFCNLLPFGLFLYFGFYFSSSLLSCTFYMTDFHCLL